MLIEESGKLKCKDCKFPIEKGQKRFYSRQPGLQGWYHWDCYKVVVRGANERGKKELIYSGATESAINVGTANQEESLGGGKFVVQIA